MVLLKNDGLLPIDPRRSPRMVVVGPLAGMLCEDWYSGTMPYGVTIASGLAGRADVVHADSADRIVLRSRTTGEPLGDTTFDVVDWGEDVVTLRCTGTGRYLSVRDDDTVGADRDVIKTWEVRETFRLERARATDDTVLLRSVLTGRYAVIVDGEVRVRAKSPGEAERWRRELLRDGTAAARAAARAADVTIVVLGNHPLINGRETEDRTGIALPDAHHATLRAVAAVCEQTALVVMSSYPYAVDWADEHLPAVVWTSHGGQETGNAVAAVLLGQAEPGGRLPQTWYRADAELPAPLDYDVIRAGWTYQYHRDAPRYPFGHGLSYTDFAYHDLRLSSDAVAGGDSIEVSVTLVNVGTRPGTEVVQLYVRALDARYEAPWLRLAGFRKVRLGPGESTDLAFTLPTERLAHWDVTTDSFTVDPGGYEVLVARSADDIVLTAPLVVTGPPPTPRVVVGRHTSAAGFDDCSAITIVDATKADGDAVRPANPAAPAALLFRAVDLSGADRVEIEVASERGARLEFRAGDRVLADVAVPRTGGRYTWTAVTAELTAPPDGVHHLWLTLHGDFRLRCFRFSSPPR